MAGGVCMAGGGMHGWGMRLGGGACMAGDMATAVDGTHPTGMYSCCRSNCEIIVIRLS